jgi:hypothetical protein
LLLSDRREEGDQLRAVARVRGAAGVLAAAGEPRLLLPPGAQRAGSNALILNVLCRSEDSEYTAALHTMDYDLWAPIYILLLRCIWIMAKTFCLCC